MTDVISITALAVSVLAALGSFVKETHIQKCKGFCFESDCRKNGTPVNSAAPSIRELPTPPIILQDRRQTLTLSESHAYDHYKTFKVSKPIDIINEVSNLA